MANTLCYNTGISNIVTGQINLGNATATAFTALLTNSAFSTTHTYVSDITEAPNYTRQNLTSVVANTIRSVGNVSWEAADITFTLSGMSNANSVVFFANTGAADNARKLVAYFPMGTWFNGVNGDTLTIYTNTGIIRVDDPNT